MFDGVHLGHRSLIASLIEDGRERGLSPVVFTFTTHPLALIDPAAAPMSLMPLGERIEELHRLGIEAVNVLEFTDDLRGMTAGMFMRLLRDEYDVRAVVIGFNHRFGSDRLSGVEAYRAAGRTVGVEVVRAGEWRMGEVDQDVSSSAIRSVLSAGDAVSAARMLGRPYRLYGRVIKGHQLGRRLGFPTANLEMVDPMQLLPAFGVYAVDVLIGDSEARRGMLNIGRRPTVDHDINAPRSVEVNIFDWSGDLYGQEIETDLLVRLRDERAFATLADLRSQLSEDRKQAMSV